MLMGFANVAFAAPLEVIFDPDPLFNKPNFLPGDETSGEVTVTNDSGVTKNILTEAINVSDNDNFGSLLHLNISGGTPYDDSLADFFSTAGEVPLGLIADGEEKTFTYTISFIDSSDNSYQGKTLGFDICVGFQGETTTHCGDTVAGGDGGGGSISGSGSSGSIILTIFDEQALNISSVDESGIATITWNTNKLATSQVIYGPTPPSYILDIVEPYWGYFGYPLGTVEDTTKVINHSVSLTGLIPGQTYVYRVVSRASPPTISSEHRFTVPSITSPLAQAGAGAVLGTSAGGGGSVSESASNGILGNVLGDTSGVTEEIPDQNENLGLVLASSLKNILSICSLIALLILLVIYLIWVLWLRKKYEKKLIPEEEIQNRFYLFFGGSTLLTIVVAILIKEYCILPIFLVVFVISLAIYSFRKLKNNRG